MSVTEKQIRDAKPKEKEYKLNVGNGLLLRVFPSGKKSWLFQYTYKGKRENISFGLYPIISLKSANEKVFELKNEMFQGRNPKDDTVNRNTVTFGKVAKEWLKKKSNACAETYMNKVTLRLNKHILPTLGEMPIAEILPIDVLNLIHEAEERKHFETAARILNISSQIFRYAVASTYCLSDPCRDLKGALTPHKHKPMSAVTLPKEVGFLIKNIKAYPKRNIKNLLLFSAYTFCRPGEIRQAEWSEIDFEAKVWRIPAEKMKMRGEHIVPLSSQCLEILHEQEGLNDTFIFPSNRANKPISAMGASAAIRAMGYTKEEMTPHGFRAMASTLLNEKGYNPDVIEKCLAHESKNKIRAIYNRAQYMPERVKLMQDYADLLDKLAIES